MSWADAMLTYEAFPRLEDVEFWETKTGREEWMEIPQAVPRDPLWYLAIKRTVTWHKVCEAMRVGVQGDFL